MSVAARIDGVALPAPGEQKVSVKMSIPARLHGGYRENIAPAHRCALLLWLLRVLLLLTDILEHRR